MPYVRPESRNYFDTPLSEIARGIDEPGELNYVISRLLALKVGGLESYSEMSRWRAAVNDASDEFYRRVMAPYEDDKAALHGDVYDEVLP